MLPSIPASDIVNILPSALSAGGSSLSLNSVVFSQASQFPVKEYFDLDSVGDDFGTTSNEYKFAQIYFNGFTRSTIKPSSIFFAEWVTTNKSAKLIGRSLRSMSLDDLKLISGTLEVVVDGVLSSGTVNLSTATSFSNAATLIATALTEVVSFDTQLQAFIVASGTTGGTSSISFASGTASNALGLSEEGGASLNNVTTPDTPITAMERVTEYTLNFAPISYVEEFTAGDEVPAFTEQWAKDVASWVSAQNHRYWFLYYSQDPTALIANNPSSFGAWLDENDIQDVTPIYGTQNHGAFACGAIASIDFTEAGGRTTLDFRNQQGITASVTSKADAKALESNGYAYYGAWATANDRFQFMRNSVVSGEFEWADTYSFQLWLNAGFEQDGIEALQQYKSIPPNADGKAIYRAIFQDRINQGVEFGGIVPGTTLTEQQRYLINREFGYDAATQIELTGWAMFVGNAVNVAGAGRKRFPAKFYYADGGSIQSINMTSTAVL